MNPRLTHFLLFAAMMAMLVVAGCDRDETGIFDPPTSDSKAQPTWDSRTGLLRGTIVLDPEELDAATGASIYVYRNLDDFRNHVADLLRAAEQIPRDDPRPDYFVIEVPVVRKRNRLTFLVELEPGEYLMTLWNDTRPNGMIDGQDAFFFVCTDDCPAPAVVQVRSQTITWIHSRPNLDVSTIQ